VSLALMVLLQFLVNRTRIGRQMRAVAFNQRTARLLGINVSQIYLFTFFLAGMLGGAGGLLYGLAFARVTPFMGQDIALVGLTALVLGGLGSIPGAVLGGFLVAILQTLSIVIGGSSYRDAVVFIVFFLILLVRPQGLLGRPGESRA
jgi:branched-chain amino acid transport system permease protein